MEKKSVFTADGTEYVFEVNTHGKLAKLIEVHEASEFNESDQWPEFPTTKPAYIK